MLDFTSALYLGLTHPTGSLCPWTQLTTGRPAVLQTTAGARAVGGALASLTGCEAATLCPSTLHVFWDFFGMIGRRRSVFLDAGAYAIGHWGAERAAARGIEVRVFRHHDARALRRGMESQRHGRPVIVADGFCPGCGTFAPIAEYLRAIEDRDGLLVLDDTQSLGVFGRSPSCDAPYGHGGGGSLRWHGIGSPQVILIASLAKAFGVPVAMLAGTTAAVRAFEAQSETRVHASPPSAAVIHGAAHALRVNAVQGDGRRSRLAARVSRFRSRLSAAGVTTSGGIFPSQTVEAPPGRDAKDLYERLLKAGIRTVLRSATGNRAAVTLLITARHSSAAVDCAAGAIAEIVRSPVT